MKILVAITNYGTSNDGYLERLIAEYQSMSHEVDIVVLSNLEKPARPGIEQIVGLPTSDPWSLPFAHKRVLAENVDRYDLFIYTEDDMLITASHIDAFFEATSILPSDEIAGFLRTETAPNGRTFYPDVNKCYHWDPKSVVKRGKNWFAYFSCEHSAFYMLTQQQLKTAIASGGFSVPPHDGHYDLACTAATDPYTQCGFKKVVCISELSRFCVSHLSNKYLGTDYDLPGSDFDLQIAALLEIGKNMRTADELIGECGSEEKLRWCKRYYEAARPDITERIARQAKTVLSVGCGWGEVEKSLIDRGIHVVGIPLDAVISSCAEARGIEVTAPNFDSAWKQLAGERFDCILMSNIVHLAPDPAKVFAEAVKLLSSKGMVIVITPNFEYAKVLWRRLRQYPGYRRLGQYSHSGVFLTSHYTVKKMLKKYGLIVTQSSSTYPDKVNKYKKLLKPAEALLTSEFCLVAQNQP